VFAERVNAAADLLDAGVPAADAARELASRFGCSPRQAHRYVQRAGRSGHVAVPAPAAVFTVKLPVPLIARVRAHAAASGRTLSAVVAQALEELLGAGASTASAPVSERVVETEFVFDRLQAAELSAAYRILVPERPSRSVRAGQEASRADEQRSDLCPGLLGSAEGAGHDPIPDRSVACARRTAGSGRAETVGV
jgi:hypothetical protein